MQANDLFKASGLCIVTAKNVETDKIISETRYENMLFSGWKSQLITDIALGTNLAKPLALALSRDNVASSPVPSSLGANEFRSGVRIFNSANKLILLSVLAAYEGNTVGTGTIKSIGFYYGPGTTTSTGTGILGSLINSLNETKNASVELSFQYEITLT